MGPLWITTGAEKTSQRLPHHALPNGNPMVPNAPPALHMSLKIPLRRPDVSPDDPQGPQGLLGTAYADETADPKDLPSSHVCPFRSM